MLSEITGYLENRQYGRGHEIGTCSIFFLLYTSCFCHKFAEPKMMFLEGPYQSHTDNEV